MSIQKLERPDLRWTAGAPEPVVLAAETRTLFAFETPEGNACIAEFAGCVSVRFGFPNDEVQYGHPVWGSEVTYNAVNEVSGSPWIEEMRRTEAVHRSAAPRPFASSRHFVLTFHDSTLEAIAEEVVVLGSAESLDAAVDVMVDAHRRRPT